MVSLWYMVYSAFTKDSSLWFKAVTSWQWKHSILTQWHTTKKITSLWYKIQMYFFVCVMHTKWQAFKNMLTAFYIALTSKWRVEHSLFIQPRWACQLQLLLLLLLFFVLFVINFLKSLCFLLCCQLCALLENFFFVPFAILVVQSSFEHKENALRHRYSCICTMQEKKVVFFHVRDTAINYQLLLLCIFVVFPNRSTS